MTAQKEPNYFSLCHGNMRFDPSTIGPAYHRDFVHDWNAYMDLFREAGEEQARGESSPVYLYDPFAADSIREQLPACRFVVLLRNPVDRAFSNYVLNLRARLEPERNFRKALNLEEQRIAQNWWWGFHYFKAGLYSEQLERYFTRFPREQFLILLYDQWRDDARATFQKVLSFIGVDEHFSPRLGKRFKESKVQNENLIKDVLDRDSLIKRLFKKTFSQRTRTKVKQYIAGKNSYKPVLDPESRLYLQERYQPEIGKLEDLLGQDLSHWLKRGEAVTK